MCSNPVTARGFGPVLALGLVGQRLAPTMCPCGENVALEACAAAPALASISSESDKPIRPTRPDPGVALSSAIDPLPGCHAQQHRFT